MPRRAADREVRQDGGSPGNQLLGAGPAGAADSEAISDDGDTGMTHFRSDQQDVKNLDDLLNRSCRPATPSKGASTPTTSSWTPQDFAGVLTSCPTIDAPSTSPSTAKSPQRPLELTNKPWPRSLCGSVARTRAAHQPAIAFEFWV
jgi:hypothetical protein